MTLEKSVETWWRSVVKGHPEIDATLVDSTKRVEEYDDETQAAIRKIMHEQHVKAQLGLDRDPMLDTPLPGGPPPGL